ncbi:MAG: oligosaccharide flippase family protein, partial [Planctomycetota bacterium]|nr:oligosaccharide flippase family protein [Planctomycetota bacterium]
MGAVSQEGDRERDELRSPTSLVRDRLFSGAAIAFVLKVGGAGLAFLLQLVLARALGKELFSTYVVAIAWVGVLVLIGKAGMDSAALRFLPEYRAKGAPGAQSGFRTASRRWVSGASIGTALIGCAVVWLLSSRLGPTTSLTLYAAFASVPILSLLQLHAGFLQAEKRIAASQGPLLCGLPLVAIILVCIVFHVLEGDRNPAVAALLYGSAALVALSVTLFIGRGGRETKEPAVFLDRSIWMNVGA